MQKLGLNEIRSRFLSFFESKEHLILPSFSLVPEKDKSLLLINSGMAPLKPYFTGQEKPPRKRIATCQKCVRTPDIDRVGKTARHGTFFEMLGNFSFGDYFKQEAISWAWEFITGDVKLPIDRLWVSIYQDDDEAFDIWKNHIGLPEHRIVRLGKQDNFWEIGVGPCGPCSEIYFDRGAEKGCQEPDCKVGCDCDRFVEFWNLVFTQFNRDENENYSKLPNPNIDTGMGLERIAAIMQGVDSLFDVDTIRNIIVKASDLTGKKYGHNAEWDVSLRVIADHARGMVFMISDGILPSNEGRGYVLRRIIRRASHHGRKLGLERNFLTEVASAVIAESGDAYNEISNNKAFILKSIENEEKRFKETISQGILILDEYIKNLQSGNSQTLDGHAAFKLYDTYGFPFDLTKEVLSENGLKVDEDEFNMHLKNQREKARSAQKQTDFLGHDGDLIDTLQVGTKSIFRGYDELSTLSKVQMILKENEAVSEAREEDCVSVILDNTAFYPEGGGQVADVGLLENNDAIIEILDTRKIQEDVIIHIGKVRKGILTVGAVVSATVDGNKRNSTARNHTVTHLLHKALRSVLGEHAEQSGSMVSPSLLRFDFRHFSSLTQEQITDIEKIVNAKIMESLHVESAEMNLEEAKKLGAVALFGEKYSEKVRVVKIGDYSMELCGGTHIKNTGNAGLFKILGENGIASGVRRIEAVTGWGTYEYLTENETILNRISLSLKTTTPDLEKRLSQLLLQTKIYEKEIESLKSKLSIGIADRLYSNAVETLGFRLIVERVDNLDTVALRSLVDALRDRIGSGVVVLASTQADKVTFVGGATKNIVEQGIHIGNIIGVVAKAAGGGGGGRADMAQAGGKDPAKAGYALSLVKNLLAEQFDKG